MNTQKEKEFTMLTDDVLFKEFFGNYKNIQFLEDLLESYYAYEKGFLKDKLKVTSETELPIIKYDDKRMRADLLVVIDNNIMVNIEMYSEFNTKKLQKSKSYIMRIYSTQLTRGKDYNEIKKVTQINFVDKVEVKISDEIKSTSYFGNEKVSNDISMDIIRLDIARKIDYNHNDRFVKWLRFLGAQTLEERKEISKGDELLMSADEALKAIANDEWFYKEGEFWLKELAAEDKAIEIARKMIKENMSKEMILKLTGLDDETVSYMIEHPVD